MESNIQHMKTTVKRILWVNRELCKVWKSFFGHRDSGYLQLSCSYTIGSVYELEAIDSYWLFRVPERRRAGSGVYSVSLPCVTPLTGTCFL